MRSELLSQEASVSVAASAVLVAVVLLILAPLPSRQMTSDDANMPSNDGKSIRKSMLDAVASSCLTVCTWPAMESLFKPLSIVLQPSQSGLSILVCLEKGLKQKGKDCHPGASHQSSSLPLRRLSRSPFSSRRRELSRQMTPDDTKYGVR